MSSHFAALRENVTANGGNVVSMTTASTMPWEPLLIDWCAWQRASGAPATTIRLRRDYIRRLGAAHADHQPWDLTTRDLLEWIAGHDWSPNTMRSVRSSLTAFYAWGVAAGHLDRSPATMLPAVRVPRGRPRPAPEHAYRRALGEADAQTALAIRLAGQCGLRLGEIARARREDVEADLLANSLRVVGKGGHVRIVPLPDDLSDLITARSPGWLFPSPNGGHLTPNHLGKRITRCLPGDLTTHTLRHRAASVAYGKTKDLRAVQELLGHQSPKTTAGYAAVADEAVRAAMLAAA